MPTLLSRLTLPPPETYVLLFGIEVLKLYCTLTHAPEKSSLKLLKAHVLLAL